jgi:hypothetical protein
MNKIVKTATAETRKHYNTPQVRNTIQRVALLLGDNEYSRWLVGDNTGWYNYNQKMKTAYSALRLHYDKVTHNFRTLHYTLSYFNPQLFQFNFNKESFEGQDDGKITSKQNVHSYTFGIDIDTIDLANGHGANIHDTDVKQAVEAMARYFVADLNIYCPNSINCLYSGGGIYVMVHHKVFDEYLSSFTDNGVIEYKDHVDILTDALNSYITAIQEKFYTEFPEYRTKVKADSINGAKRVFKTIFSIHKKHPYVVIPLDQNNLVIDFQKATIPLSKEVLSSGEAWYQEYDSGEEFMEMLKPYFSAAEEKQVKQIRMENNTNGIVLVSENPYIKMEEYPPCVQNIFNLQTCGAGATRALAFIAAFLGQVGYPQEEAFTIWTALADKWHASKSNIFESWYQKMNCPGCRKLREKGAGYPSIDISNLNVCKPDGKCYLRDFSNPVYYTDHKQYIEKLKRDIFL